MPSVRRCTKASKEKIGKKCNKVMSRAVGVKKKPQEAQKAKAQWAMKAAKDRKGEICDPAREEDIAKRKRTRL